MLANMFARKSFPVLLQSPINAGAFCMIAGLIIVLLIPCFSVKAEASDFGAEYAGILYTEDSGLDSVEVNALVQTKDGYIWAGTYTGLYVYDGYRFKLKDIDDRIRNMDPVSFLRFLKERMNVKLIVAGTDFRFGYRRSGDSRTLQQYADAFGYSCVIVDKLVCEGAEISSTRIRTCVIEGKIELANRLLGYPYLIMGEVIHGEGVGRKGGFPTVNLRPDEQKLLPPNGVYFSTAEVDGTRYPAITNIGKKPTAGHFPVGVETYLLDFAGDLYGREVIIYLHCFRRPEQRFESFDALREQIGRDLDACRAYFLEHPTEKSVDKLYFTQYN
jgi:riboflavin kinase/FMN adenylyltransferase